MDLLLRPRARPLALAVFAALALLVASCGSDGATTQTTSPSDSGTGADPADDASDTDAGTESDGTDPQAAADAAEANMDDLEESDDIRSFEVLDVATGEPTSIRDTVTGDRPVLLWFWAPH